MLNVPKMTLKRAGISLLIFAGLLFALVMLNMPPKVSAGSENVCPSTGMWTKVDGLSGFTYTYNDVKDGCQVVENCMKVGSHDPLFGTGPTVTNDSLKNQNGQLQDISHASFKIKCDDEGRSVIRKTFMCYDPQQGYYFRIRNDGNATSGIITYKLGSGSQTQIPGDGKLDPAETFFFYTTADKVLTVYEDGVSKGTATGNKENLCEVKPEPVYNLSVGSCLYEGTSKFEVKMVNKGDAAKWRLKKAGSSDVIGEVEFAANETKVYETLIEGTWTKQYWNGSSWVNKGGTHVTNVAGHTKHEFFCKEDPTPTPEPTPTPSTPPIGGPNGGDDNGGDNGEEGKHTSLGFETNCDEQTVTASFRMTDRGEAVKDAEVVFKYDGKEVRTTTNSTGYAYATFAYASGDGEHELSAESVNFGSQRTNVEYVCSTGQVLGAMTYAATGQFEDRALIGLIALSVMSIIGGVYLQIKKA